MTFEEYVSVKKTLRAKDEKLIHAHAKLLTGLSRHTHEREFRLLDLGSGEGSLLQGVCEKLATDSPAIRAGRQHLRVDCVEPNPAAQAKLREFKRWAKERGIAVHLHPLTLQQALGRMKGRFHAVTCCHTLYFVPPAQWPRVIENVRSRLTPNGKAFINLVSSTSDVYRLGQTVQARASQPLTSTDENGRLLFAEDLRRVLNESQTPYAVQEVRAPFSFSPREQKCPNERHAQPLCQDSPLNRFLAFMLRVDPAQLAPLARDALQDKLAKRGTLTFQSIDHLFTVKPHK